jgi:hypothetical protein
MNMNKKTMRTKLFLFLVMGTLLICMSILGTPVNAQITHTLTYTAGTHGSITGTSPQTVNYRHNHGDSGTAVTAVPNTGYHFVKWSDDSTDNPRTDTDVTADITVEASFAIDTYTITASAGSGGSISPSGAVPVDYNADQALTITPIPATMLPMSWWIAPLREP